jgi:hypothetical protein
MFTVRSIPSRGFGKAFFLDPRDFSCRRMAAAGAGGI